MLLLTALSFVGGILGFIGATLSIASALYYVSEFVEEHSRFARRCIERCIYAICIFLALSWITDGLPFLLVCLGLASHAVYHYNLATFPFIRVTSGRFIGGALLTVLNHYLWFRHFGAIQRARREYLQYGHTSDWTSFRRGSSSNGGPPEVTFSQVASFFMLCVWLVPFALFVSLSAGDNVLPTTATAPALGTDTAVAGQSEGIQAKRPTNLVKHLYAAIGSRAAPILRTLGITDDEGHLARANARYA
ncbi:erv26 super protein [Savitreella phatthalungensis]